MNDLDAYGRAKLLLDQHGADAEIQAAMRADALDGAGRRAWMRILAAVDELRRIEPRPWERVQ